MDAVMSAEDLEEFLAERFPQAFHADAGYKITSVTARTACVTLKYNPSMLRPGETVSGPTLMTLADVAMYVAVLAALGPVALAVTTNLAINFLRKPPAGRDLRSEARLLKVGKRLAVGEVTLYSEGITEPVAHVTSTYSIPG